MDEATREAIYEAIKPVVAQIEADSGRQRRLNADMKYAISHTEEWRKKYPDHWVAVFNCELIAVDRSIDRFREAMEATGVPLTEVYFEFLPRENVLLML